MIGQQSAFRIVVSLFSVAILLASDAYAQLLEAPVITFEQSGECGQSRAIVVRALANDGIAHASVRAQFMVGATVSFFKDGQLLVTLPQESTPTDHLTMRFEVPAGVAGVVDVTVTTAVIRGSRMRSDYQTLETSSTTARGMDVGEDPMRAIYGAIGMQIVWPTEAIYVRGERPMGEYSLTNQSEKDLCVPTDPWQPYHTVGVIQAWVERLGDDNTIPSIPSIIFRDALGRYAAGGSLIATDVSFPNHRWPSGVTILNSWYMLHDTTEFPAGRYRYHQEYKKRASDGGTVVQSSSIDFEIQ